MELQFAKRYDGITGSAIRRIFSLLGDPDIISFAGGNPSPDTFPSEELSHIAAELIAKHGDTVLQYGGTVGTGAMMETAKQLFCDQGFDPKNEELIVLSGSSQGIDLMTKAFIEKGDRILVEDPTFLGAIQTFRLFEAQVEGVKMDEYGMDMEDLEKKLDVFRPKFVYTIPTFQNPTGKTMPADRRKAMVELCRKYGALILEDDPYAELRFTGQAQPAIKSFDDENHTVLKLMSFSKTISPGLRVGAAYGHKDIIAKFNLGKQGQDVHTANLNQLMVAKFVEKGLFRPHIESIIEKYAGKAKLMCDLADKYFPKGSKTVRPEGGMFTWTDLPEGMDALELFPKAVEAKVAYVPGTHFYAGGGHMNTLRLNYTMASVEQIEKGMKRLGDLLCEKAAQL